MEERKQERKDERENDKTKEENVSVIYLTGGTTFTLEIGFLRSTYVYIDRNPYSNVTIIFTHTKEHGYRNKVGKEGEFVNSLLSKELYI